METFEYKYVAYCDILGFSNAVTTDFENTVKIYRQFKEELKMSEIFQEIEVSVVSDSIMIVGDKLIKVAEVVQILILWTASRKEWLVRGGIAYGRHWKQIDGSNILIVSEALVKAVNIEKVILHPIVVISNEIPLGLEYWGHAFGNSVFSLPIINYDNNNIVNPFNNYWFKSVEIILHQLKSKHQVHSSKYDYLLKLIDAIKGKGCFIPQTLINDLLEKGLIEKKPD